MKIAGGMDTGLSLWKTRNFHMNLNHGRKLISNRRIKNRGLAVCFLRSSPTTRISSSTLCRGKNGSGDQSSSDEYQMQKLEIQEPAIEQGAEQAALSVVAATVFGAILWGVLGSTKGEGVCHLTWMNMHCFIINVASSIL